MFWIVAALALAPVASAEAAGARQGEGFDQFVAAPGEQNHLTISTDQTTVTFHDAANPVTSDGCTQVDAQTARCRLGEISIDLGDGDDTFAFAADSPRQDSVVVNGGAGDDRLRAGAGHDFLYGGGGRDSLDGGAGSDLLVDNDGTGGAVVDADVLEGGAGHDAVSYIRNSRVVVNLTRPAPQGGAREGDRITGVETVDGGAGNDLLIGNAGPNRLNGGNGADVIRGGGGNDHLAGNAGRDAIDGGAGNDTVSGIGRLGTLSANTPGDSIQCGPGRDRIEAVNPRAILAADCERVQLPLGAAPVRPTRTRTAPTYRMPCSAQGIHSTTSCRARVTLRDSAGRLVASGSGSGAVRATGATRAARVYFTVRLRLTATGRRLLRGHKTHTLRNSLVMRSDTPRRAHIHETTSYRFRFHG